MRALESEITALAEEQGFTVCNEDRDLFGEARSMSWHSPTKNVIVHVTFGGPPEHVSGQAIKATRSTTDPLGWAATLLAEWLPGQPEHELAELFTPEP